MQALMQPILAGFSILQLILIALGVIATLTLAAAAGFFIARRYYTTDTDARMGLYQRELVRQKRRSSDGSSQSTLMRRERDRARRHVQRTVRLRQTAAAKAEGRPVKRQYAPANILRPMALSQQAEVGSVYEPEGNAMSRVKQSAKSLMNSFNRAKPKSPEDDGIDALVAEAARPSPVMEPASDAQDAPGTTWTAPEQAARPVARPAPQLMRSEPVPAPLATAAPRVSSSGRLNAVMGRASASAPVTAPVMPTAPVEPVAAETDVELYTQAPVQAPAPAADPMPMRQTAAVAVPGALPMPEPAPSAPVAAPAEPAASGNRASSSDLKRRLAQVRERNSAQRAQMASGTEPMRKTS